jgi:hypothetical protein
MRMALTALMLLSGSLMADTAIYEGGIKTFTCTAVQPTTAPPAPVPDAYGTFTWSHTTGGNNAPANPQPLYDQMVLSPGQVYIELLVGKVHHVDFFNGSTRLRTEKVYPYTHWATLAAGQYHLVARVYSDATTLASTHQVTFYVADNGADAAQTPRYEVIVQWEPTTARENGEPLGPGDMSGYRVSYGQGSLMVPPTEKSVSLLLPGGAYEVTLVAVDIDGLESLPSDPWPLRLP